MSMRFKQEQASDPNSDPVLLSQLVREVSCVELVLTNPVLPLLALEDPNRHLKILTGAVYARLVAAHEQAHAKYNPLDRAGVKATHNLNRGLSVALLDEIKEQVLAYPTLCAAKHTTTALNKDLHFYRLRFLYPSRAPQFYVSGLQNIEQDPNFTAACPLCTWTRFLFAICTTGYENVPLDAYVALFCLVLPPEQWLSTSNKIASLLQNHGTSAD